MVRFKNRYLLVQLIPVFSAPVFEEHQPSKRPRLGDVVQNSDTKAELRVPAVSASSIASHVRSAIDANFGTVGTAANTLALSVKYCNNTTRMAIVRCAREHECMVRSSIVLSASWPSRQDAANARDESLKCIWMVVHVAGTMRSCQAAAIAHGVREINRLIRLETDEKKLADLNAVKHEISKTISALEA